ncbi:MAG: RluA family pseudouridine synthase [bacterium]
MAEKQIKIKVGTRSDKKIRLDTLLAEYKSPPSRSQWAHLIKEGHVTIDGRKIKPGYIIKGGEYLEATIPPPQPLELIPEQIPLDIIFEDHDILVINKAAGMVVHPGAGNTHHTLVHALLAHCHDLSGIGGKQRPGIVHRLDKDTSGLLVVAKNDRAHLSLSQQIKEKKVLKMYSAVVYGELEHETGKIEIPITRHPKDRKRMSPHPQKGKSAITFYRIVKRFRHFTYLELELKTGRTHQIRVHLNHIHHPVVGDAVYGHRKPPENCPKELKDAIKSLKGQALHAGKLGFYHPRSQQYLEFSAPIPHVMSRIIELLHTYMT